MRKLTNSQRIAIKKTLCLLFSICLFVGSLAAVPYIVSAVPHLTGSAAQDVLSNSGALAETIPVFALGTGTPEKKPETSQPQESQPEESLPQQDEPIIDTSKPQSKPTPDGDSLFVTPDNLCWYEKNELPALNIIDRTSYSVNLNDYASREFPVRGQITAEPLVLILHTHGSESYLPAGYDFYSPDEDFRSTTESETVVHIGNLLCQRLNALGIPTVHDKTMHDVPDYSQSYNNSLRAIKATLAKYPSIQFVIDLHRDSVFDSNGNNIKPLTNINNKDCAQLMLVVGTNEMGVPHPNWRDNLTFATYLQQTANQMYPTLMRPINLRTAEFNQAVTKGSIILEVGSCGNTVEEAENSILLFADAYARLLKEQLS